MRPFGLISYIFLTRRDRLAHVLHEDVLTTEWRTTVVSLSAPPQRPSSPPLKDARAPEQSGVQTKAVDEIEMPLPSNPQTFFLGSLLALAVLAALYAASSIILPVVLAFVLQLARSWPRQCWPS